MAVATKDGIASIEQLLGDEAESLLRHSCKTIDKSLLHLPGPDFLDRVVALNDRPNQVLRSLQSMYGSARTAWEMGAAGVGATIYFGSEQSRRQIVEVSEAFEEAHSLGMFTVLWCYLRNSAFKQDGVDYSLAADLTGQANHIGVTIKADIIKQKAPENNNGYGAVSSASGKSYGQTNAKVYSELTTDHPIDLTRYQVANCYMGRAPLINSGGASSGESDLAEAVRTAVINKRAGGVGLISGRKAFQRPTADGVDLLHAIQDVYLEDEVTVA